MTVEEKLRPFLPPTNLEELPLGRVVLCFQPGLGTRRIIEIFLLSEVRGDRRTPGWWFGTLEEIDDEGWAIIKTPGENGTKWDCDGRDFPVYDPAHLPPKLARLFENCEHLNEFLASRPTMTLEEEFFTR